MALAWELLEKVFAG